jgi:hypothetical protein
MIRRSDNTFIRWHLLHQDVGKLLGMTRKLAERIAAEGFVKDFGSVSCQTFSHSSYL